jgi:hypothetical protein
MSRAGTTMKKGERTTRKKKKTALPFKNRRKHSNNLGA